MTIDCCSTARLRTSLPKDPFATRTPGPSYLPASLLAHDTGSNLPARQIMSPVYGLPEHPEQRN